MTDSEFVSKHDIRTYFSQAMSDMYRKEVPSYGDLVNLVERVNRDHLDANPELREHMASNQEFDRLSLERHGAIRVGTAKELSFLRRIFAVMGMFPVGYYDLSVAGIPVHSTAFRPTDSESLRRNPFRLFTSLLRLDLIADPELRHTAHQLLSERNIFTPRATELVVKAEQQGGLTDQQAREFTHEIVATFRWHQQATVNHTTYEALREEHPLIADVVCFKGPHINHLTPRTLDIDRVQSEMRGIGVVPKQRIEGPPARQNPILLRQTSYKALDESIAFLDSYHGTHTARFGEVETRGIALTPKGRALYDELLKDVLAKPESNSPEGYQENLEQIFSRFPDDLAALRREELAYFVYKKATTNGPADKNEWAMSLEELVQAGKVIAKPIIYEDFLPVSAAGIFRSNLRDEVEQEYEGTSNQKAFEKALGASVIDEFSMYAAIEKASLSALRIP